jgi:GNAT superfamily N-acetyltransferase
VAQRQGDIDEAALHFRLPPGERYLWDFATLPEWRGRGLYPRLLQAIIRLEDAGGQRLWIGHETGNDASRKGIERAGFRVVGAVHGVPGRLWMDPVGPAERSEAAACLLEVPLGSAPPG